MTDPHLIVYHHRYSGQANDLLTNIQRHYFYPFGEDRATGYLRLDDEPWLNPLLADLADLLGVRFTILAFQAYRNGNAGTDWHTDTPFDAQAIVSLGATRVLGIRRNSGEFMIPLGAGDLAYMPSGFQTVWEHRLPPQPDARGERVSLVFRTPLPVTVAA